MKLSNKIVSFHLVFLFSSSVVTKKTPHLDSTLASAFRDLTTCNVPSNVLLVLALAFCFIYFFEKKE